MIALVKMPAGQKWHAYTGYKTECGMSFRSSTRAYVNSVWSKPVNGNTCIVCQPFILKQLKGQKGL